MNDDELMEYCISNYGCVFCEDCPHGKECDDFVERHDGRTPILCPTTNTGNNKRKENKNGNMDSNTILS